VEGPCQSQDEKKRFIIVLHDHVSSQIKWLENRSGWPRDGFRSESCSTGHLPRGERGLPRCERI